MSTEVASCKTAQRTFKCIQYKESTDISQINVLTHTPIVQLQSEWGNNSCRVNMVNVFSLGTIDNLRL